MVMITYTSNKYKLIGNPIPIHKKTPKFYRSPR